MAARRRRFKITSTTNSGWLSSEPGNGRRIIYNPIELLFADQSGRPSAPTAPKPIGRWLSGPRSSGLDPPGVGDLQMPAAPVEAENALLSNPNADRPPGRPGANRIPAISKKTLLDRDDSRGCRRAGETHPPGPNSGRSARRSRRMSSEPREGGGYQVRLRTGDPTCSSALPRKLLARQKRRDPRVHQAEGQLPSG